MHIVSISNIFEKKKKKKDELTIGNMCLLHYDELSRKLIKTH